MDVRNVIVLIDYVNWDRNRVTNELIAEGYTHNFFFGNAPVRDDFEKFLDQSDEVWCFGDCKLMDEYKLAKAKGKDLWQMG